jgi:hypothetical protein
MALSNNSKGDFPVSILLPNPIHAINANFPKNPIPILSPFLSFSLFLSNRLIPKNNQAPIHHKVRAFPRKAFCSAFMFGK